MYLCMADVLAGFYESGKPGIHPKEIDLSTPVPSWTIGRTSGAFFTPGLSGRLNSSGRTLRRSISRAGWRL